MKILLLYVSILLLAGCNLFQGKQPAGESVVVEEKQQQEEVFVPVEKELYVINKNHIPLYEDIQSIKDSIFNQYAYFFGENVNIIAESAHFCKTKQNYFILKQDVGSWEALKGLFTSDFLEETDYSSHKRSIEEFFFIEQISHDEYQKALQNKIDFLTEDTLITAKNKGVIVLKCKNKTVFLKDQDNDIPPYVQYFQYLGQVEMLNQYLVSINEGDNFGYFFIDKTTGTKTYMEYFPYLSPNHEYIISLGRNLQDEEGKSFISLYKVERKVPLSLKKVLDEAPIKGWVVYNFGREPIFWNENGLLYASINPSMCFYNEENKPNKQRMYIKIGIRN